ncbi:MULTISPECIES: hypothetical protein [Streptomyces]|uniref:hypothetical protein n=1 Tax=Streptomyces TaxID=1883 RepID=UPI0003A90B43|nr:MULTISPECIES: hypothetical protein [Streptomyces]MBZ6110108.1 hypothetical protein [Streptomyces olivaceus]MBZ6124705.1 hypothetical protein [Streptomyces olivaceus]MBZ6144813.1 hypothetical protein [Streptomyces olivaceus]MBZ6159073.1 hypothetical protein [Streptomyces olivaceus]MBZ6187195.1 hypothetical protein [Streptomyces olivaceus]
MTNAQLTEMRHALNIMRMCLNSLRTNGGTTLHLLRLVNDVDRLQMDLDDMAGSGRPEPEAAPGFARDEVVYIADGYLVWHDADDEGIGGHRQ